MNKLLTLLIFPLLLSTSCSQIEKNKTRNLSNENWKFYSESDSTAYSAKIPGSIHTDLLKNNLVEEFYYRNNEYKLDWVANENWIYETQFNLTNNDLNFQNIELVCKGLDTYADVFLNEQLILQANNYFRIWRSNVKNALTKGNNYLKIKFYSAKKHTNFLKNQDSIPLMENYAYARKPAYHFGWDWGPKMITCGIWDNIELSFWNNAIIRNLQVVQSEVSQEKAKLELKYEIQSLQEASFDLNIEIENERTISRTLKLKKGINFISIPTEIESPQLWWTHNLGKPHLYKFTSQLNKNENCLSQHNCKIGIRKLELIQEKDSLGKSFYFKLNDVPIFAKGANIIPQDIFISELTDSNYAQLISDAKEVNVNMLRVWGGGIYEKDIFYDLCDENGILVWQDFMFACALYPGDSSYLQNVKQEVKEQVKRLRNHPSIALWCGNNENLMGWHYWGWQKQYSEQERKQVWTDYENLFHKLIPEVLKEEDNSRAYWPSSLTNNWNIPVNTSGDVHYWGVWHGQEPFEVMEKEEKIGRFVSEFGFQSCPEFESVKKYSDSSDWNINSEVMRTHQKHRIGYPVIDKYMNWYFKKPKDFESYLYVSQVLQAFGMKKAIEAQRRAMPACMGSLYWQLNDCYPVASWSSIDVYGKWKAMHYELKRLFKDVLISCTQKENKLNVFITSDLLDEQDLHLKTSLMNFEGKKLFSAEKKIKLKANTAKQYLSLNLNEMTGSLDSSSTFLRLELYDKNKIVAEKSYFFAYPKDLNLKKSHIDFKLESKGDYYELALNSKQLVKNLFISTSSLDCKYSDNYFDLIPNKTKTIRIYTSEKITNNMINFRSLIDSFDNAIRN